jgi:hypothetical protein
VSGIAAALHLLQDAAIIPIAKYLHGVVGERIRRLFPENPDLFQWEGFLSQWRSGAGKGVVVIGAPAGLAVALFPGFAALLGVGFGVASSAELRSALDIVHALLASVGAGFLIADVIYRLRIAQHYRKVAPA